MELSKEFFSKCEFCGEIVVKRQYNIHADFCLENPNRKSRKRKK